MQWRKAVQTQMQIKKPNKMPMVKMAKTMQSKQLITYFFLSSNVDADKRKSSELM